MLSIRITPNPLEGLQAALGVDRATLARMLACPYHRLYEAERSGAALPRRCYEPLRELGISPEELAEALRVWHGEHAVQLRRELKARDNLPVGEVGAP